MATVRRADAKKPNASKDELLGYYREMLLIRRFEEKAGQLYGLGLIGGFCHLYIGQEAVAVGLQAAAKEGDSVITGYRDHGHMLAYGIDPKVIMAELTGRAAGHSARQGRLDAHVLHASRTSTAATASSARRCRSAPASPSPTSTAAMAASASPISATARRTRARSTRAFNMAALWKLPIIFVIENNQYAMGTSRQARLGRGRRSTAAATAFRIPGEEVDGMDVLAVRRRPRRRVAHVRAGKGPVLLELKTYRYRGHSMSDPAKYRTREEVQEMREKRDPIEHVRDLLIADGLATEDELKEIDKEIKAVVAEAADFAEDSPEPAEAELYTDVAWGSELMAIEDPDAGAVADDGGRHARQMAGQGGRRGHAPAISSPRSRPTRRRWSSRRSTRACIGKILVPEGTEGVKVGTVIAG